MTSTQSPENNPGAADIARGLEGLVVANSSITFLDGQKGRMLYRGYNCPDLAGRVTFEEVVHLLWEGELPNKKQLAEFSKHFLEYRALPADLLSLLKTLPKTTHPMDVLRLAVAFMGIHDAKALDHSEESLRRVSVLLTARLASVAAVWERVRCSREVVAPDNALTLSANFLYMMSGKKPDPFEAQALDMYLVLMADHDFNASTFATRVTVSTLSDIYSAVCAGIGTLRGPLHGGANEKAMQMFLEIGDVSKAEGYIEQALAEKKKIMGFGHRVYKVEDPRSVPLKDMARRLSEYKKEPRWYDIAVKVAGVVQARKKMYTNVDFYSAPVLYLLGIPIDLFTALFAVSRVAGWTTHVREQILDNRLIRPLSQYVGPAEREFVPIDQRG